jgi:hypothetical protein
MACGGKPLLLKNPSNTARIPFLLSMFPNARFIHIYRNPYEIFFSCRKMLLSLCEIMHLQHYTTPQIEALLIENYTKLMHRYFEDRKQINKNQLVEIRYETFLESPLEHLQSVYDQLQLPGFEAAKPDLAEYIQSQREYKKNRFDFDPAILERLQREWQFTIDEWGYSIPQ